MICGVDEAGKGAVLGPMVVAAVGCNDLKEWKEIPVRDSKKLAPRRREKLYGEIRSRFPIAVTIIPADEIDRRRQTQGMNQIVAEAHAGVIMQLSADMAIVDACDVNAARYQETVSALVSSSCAVVAEHQADSRHEVVAAASIVAKVIRDREIAQLTGQYKEIGSGYPSDPVTIRFLKDFIAAHREAPPIARNSWKTVTHLLDRLEQKNLSEFYQ